MQNNELVDYFKSQKCKYKKGSMIIPMDIIPKEYKYWKEESHNAPFEDYSLNFPAPIGEVKVTNHFYGESDINYVNVLCAELANRMGFKTASFMPAVFDDNLCLMKKEVSDEHTLYAKDFFDILKRVEGYDKEYWCNGLLSDENKPLLNHFTKEGLKKQLEMRLFNICVMDIDKLNYSENFSYILDNDNNIKDIVLNDFSYVSKRVDDYAENMSFSRKMKYRMSFLSEDKKYLDSKENIIKSMSSEKMRKYGFSVDEFITKLEDLNLKEVVEDIEESTGLAKNIKIATCLECQIADTLSILQNIQKEKENRKSIKKATEQGL